MPIPTGPQTDLILIQADFAFGRLKDLFNAPAGSYHPNHLLQGGPDWSKHQVEAEIALIEEAATYQEPMLLVIEAPMLNRELGPVKGTWPFRPFPHAHPVPVRFANQSYRIGGCHLANPLLGDDSDWLIGTNSQHKGDLLPLQPDP